MKASELRIGNFIQVIATKKMIKVSSQTIYEGTEDLFDGIPLTEEWLLKFGFKKNGDYFLFENWAFELLDQGTDFTVFDSGGLKVAHIKYIHQLQNLVFALIGEELKLKS